MATGKGSLGLTRMSREQAQPLLSTLINFLEGQEVFIGGSWIRGCKTIGDFDIAMIKNNHTDDGIASMLIKYDGRQLRGGKTPSYLLSDAGLKFKLDIWFTAADGWGPTCMFVAGDGMFNIVQRTKASKMGYTLGFYLKQKNVIIPMHTERAVYEHLGWDWIPYSERSLWAK